MNTFLNHTQVYEVGSVDAGLENTRDSRRKQHCNKCIMLMQMQMHSATYSAVSGDVWVILKMEPRFLSSSSAFVWPKIRGALANMSSRCRTARLIDTTRATPYYCWQALLGMAGWCNISETCTYRNCWTSHQRVYVLIIECVLKSACVRCLQLDREDTGKLQFCITQT